MSRVLPSVRARGPASAWLTYVLTFVLAVLVSGRPAPSYEYVAASAPQGVERDTQRGHSTGRESVDRSRGIIDHAIVPSDIDIERPTGVDDAFGHDLAASVPRWVVLPSRSVLGRSPFSERRFAPSRARARALLMVFLN